MQFIKLKVYLKIYVQILYYISVKIQSRPYLVLLYLFVFI